MLRSTNIHWRFGRYLRPLRNRRISNASLGAWLLIVTSSLSLGGCEGTPVLTAGAIGLGKLSVKQTNAKGSGVMVDALYDPPTGPLVVPRTQNLSPQSESVAWGLNLDDAVDYLGVLEPVWGEVLDQQWKQRRSERESHEVPYIPGASRTLLYQQTPGCPTPDFDGARLVSDCLPSKYDEIENPDDDSYLALAEYQSTLVADRQAAFYDTSVLVRVYYLFCAEHVSHLLHPIGREFSKTDLFLCGQELDFVDGVNAPARQQFLRWLLEHFGTTPGIEHVATLIGDDGPNTEAHDHTGSNASASAPSASIESVREPAATEGETDEPFQKGGVDGDELGPRYQIGPAPTHLEQYRWCGPLSGNEAYAPCEASVVFAHDPRTHHGTVLIATRPVYQYLAARRYLTQANFFLPRFNRKLRHLALLFERPEQYVKGKQPLLCEECGPGSIGITPEERLRFTPDP